MRLDSRYLLTSEGGISLARSALKDGASLCDFCTIQGACPDRAKSTERCPVFVPGLSFVPPMIGLKGRFSTFRASRVWYDRAQVIFRTHKDVGIYNAQTLELVSKAKLVGAFRGPFHQLMKEHAWSNHLCQGRNISREDAPTWLPRQIRNLAGSRYVKSPDQKCTVIYLDTRPFEPLELVGSNG